MYKIFINEHPLVITNNENDFFGSRNYRIVDDNDKSIRTAVEMLESIDKKMNNFGLMVMTENAEETFKNFSKRFSKVISAGGIVYNKAGELLLIYRQGKWDLPKGKKDQGESIEDAAIREVQEECGIKKLSIQNYCTSSYHTYFMDGKRVLKTTFWYNMLSDGQETLKPQLEENITQVKWFETAKIDLANLDTYNSIRSVLEIALERKPES
jgi:ADP-ribose pyrophosphatase YjhB (NUDIX family)